MASPCNYGTVRHKALAAEGAVISARFHQRRNDEAEPDFSYRILRTSTARIPARRAASSPKSVSS